MQRKNTSLSLTCASAIGLAIAWSGSSSALPIICGSAQRTATLDPALQCEMGTGNPQAGDILAHYPPDPWTRSDALSFTFTSGGFDANAVTGTWTIASSFWSAFGEAVVSIHIGNGQGDPDYFAWLISPNATSGTLSYTRLSGGGGGFSNIALWGRGTPTSVPEPAALVLLGAGLLAVAAQRRLRRKK
jgi:hypothetical protein